ncbi:hypothetical protein [Clostridium felsineum]|uniref:hypothetical protein n=1 Tax=Clostridium felsineum TaxID=36839 RepID=UPI001474F1D5|nr:hypothetical protein [Clostridium felsineum]
MDYRKCAHYQCKNCEYCCEEDFCSVVGYCPCCSCDENCSRSTIRSNYKKIGEDK